MSSNYCHNESLTQYRPHCTGEGIETQNYSRWLQHQGLKPGILMLGPVLVITVLLKPL